MSAAVHVKYKEKQAVLLDRGTCFLLFVEVVRVEWKYGAISFYSIHDPTLFSSWIMRMVNGIEVYVKLDGKSRWCCAIAHIVLHFLFA
jgi:hypothetical protein